MEGTWEEAGGLLPECLLKLLWLTPACLVSESSPQADVQDGEEDVESQGTVEEKPGVAPCAEAQEEEEEAEEGSKRASTSGKAFEEPVFGGARSRGQAERGSSCGIIEELYSALD